MRPALAGRLSRVLVGCHPRRWRDRYREEMLDVLDQHQASARTVLNLAASAASAHVDPAWRTERLCPAATRGTPGRCPDLPQRAWPGLGRDSEPGVVPWALRGPFAGPPRSAAGPRRPAWAPGAPRRPLWPRRPLRSGSHQLLREDQGEYDLVHP